MFRDIFDWLDSLVDRKPLMAYALVVAIVILQPCQAISIAWLQKDNFVETAEMVGTTTTVLGLVGVAMANVGFSVLVLAGLMRGFSRRRRRQQAIHNVRAPY